MAKRLLNLNENLLVYRRHSLSSLSVWVRTISSQNRDSSKSSELPANPSKVQSEPKSKWLNIRAGIFGPEDERLPLPGNVGLDHYFNNSERNTKKDNDELENVIKRRKAENKFRRMSLENLTNSLRSNQENNLECLDSLQTLVCMKSNEKMEQARESDSEEIRLECRVQECPQLLKKDCQTLFFDIDMMKQPMTVITLCQKTDNDMSKWSEDVEVEREELVCSFINCAYDLCEELVSKGYWADFIDPTTGRPFKASYTNSTLFETDENYMYLGFTIEDLGCCKVISHKSWGTRIFVGCLFTTAPVNSEVIETALHTQKITLNTL